MHYTVYKITNTINGKIYIGCHKTKDMNDGYMGSGKLIKRAIEKYGVDNFKKEILATFESEDQMFDEEKNLISKFNPEYNLHEGGSGGWSYINTSGLNYNGGKTGLHKRSKEDRIKYSRMGGIARNEKHGTPRNSFLGKKHTEETKRKIGKRNSINQKGKNNSNYGTTWITNGVKNKKIKKDVDIIPEGWYKGRVMKHTDEDP